jgi:hemoglobin-like flavoprotein
MDKQTLQRFEESLARCNESPMFLDRFYEIFLSSSPKVQAKFVHTDFVRQKRALRASLHLMLLVADDEEKGPDRYLRDLAVQHSKAQLDVGAELYDLWLDSLLAAVKECDPRHDSAVARAWEDVMMVGIAYLLSHYNPRQEGTRG